MFRCEIELTCSGAGGARKISGRCRQATRAAARVSRLVQVEALEDELHGGHAAVRSAARPDLNPYLRDPYLPEDPSSRARVLLARPKYLRGRSRAGGLLHSTHGRHVVENARRERTWRTRHGVGAPAAQCVARGSVLSGGCASRDAPLCHTRAQAALRRPLPTRSFSARRSAGSMMPTTGILRARCRRTTTRLSSTMIGAQRSRAARARACRGRLTRGAFVPHYTARARRSAPNAR